MRRLLATIGLGVMLVMPARASAAAEPVRIVLVEPRSGAGAPEALHGEQGFRLGLDDATGGTRAVRGRPVELTIHEDRGDPAATGLLLAAAYRAGTADLAVALGSSETALALLPVAASFKRILLVAQAHADAITGADRNRYVFRTAYSAGLLALAGALAVALPELNLFVAAEDTRDGRDTVADLKAALGRFATGTFFVGSRLVLPQGTDVGRAVSAEFDGLHDLHGAKTLLTVWAGAKPPIRAIAATDPGRFGIRLALGGNLDPNAPLPGVALEGVTAYFYAMPLNPVNDRLVAAWRRRYRARPDSFAAGGMTAALALVAALKAAPAMETEALVATMEGLRFETPKGGMIFRREDHQALQVMFQFRSTPPAAGDARAPAPELVHEFTIPELPLAVQPGPG